MPIIKCDNHIEAYRQKARSKDLNELSGRTGRPDLTRFVSERILRQLHLKKADVLVDIGCGDGTLLKLASLMVRDGIGILPTKEEAERVRSAVETPCAKIKVRESLLQRMDLETGIADKVVCNSVVLLLAENDVDGALREIVRISRPGALVYIGEIPTKNEFEDRTYGDSVVHWLWWVLTKQGVTAFGRRLRQVLKAVFSREIFLTYPKTLFFEPEDKFIERAKRAGLTLESSFPHLEKTEDDQVQPNVTRIDYLFRTEKRNGSE